MTLHVAWANITKNVVFTWSNKLEFNKLLPQSKVTGTIYTMKPNWTLIMQHCILVWAAHFVLFLLHEQLKWWYAKFSSLDGALHSNSHTMKMSLCCIAKCHLTISIKYHPSESNNRIRHLQRRNCSIVKMTQQVNGLVLCFQ